MSAFELGVPVTLIGEAVFARFISSLKEERTFASSVFPRDSVEFKGDTATVIEHIRRALLASKIVSYAQGFMLLQAASREHSWNLNLGQIAMIWREGCIIRSVFLEKIKEAFNRNQANLLLDTYFRTVIKDCSISWRKTVALAIETGIPVPAFSAALAFFDAYRCEKSPANLIQAQRDFFGAHLYERIDSPRGQFFHTEWKGKGEIASSIPSAT